MLSKDEALTELSHHDHGFLIEEEARKIAEPFGIQPALYIATDTRDQFKGLTLAGGRKGDKAKGIGAHELAEQIAHHLGCKWYIPMGRGSALRNAIAAAREKLKEEADANTLGN